VRAGSQLIIYLFFLPVPAHRSFCAIFSLLQDRLAASGRSLEAATVLLEFADDVELAVSALCDGQAFSQAIRTVASTYLVVDLI
jgi:hypothetical protein